MPVAMLKSHTFASATFVLAAGLFIVGCGDTSTPPAESNDAVTPAANVVPTEETGDANTESDAAAVDGAVLDPDPETLAAAEPYPLDVCIASGEKLGSMGEPVVAVYQGQQIKFCCASCIDMFNEEPATYMARLARASADNAAGAAIPNTGHEHDHDHDHDHAH